LPEPRAHTADVRSILRRVVLPDTPNEGDAVATLAAQAGTSTRTIYRILGGEYAETMKLDLADRLLIASGAMLHEIRVRTAAGELLDYLDAP
jgi:hypothetical protein